MLTAGLFGYKGQIVCAYLYDDRLGVCGTVFKDWMMTEVVGRQTSTDSVQRKHNRRIRSAVLKLFVSHSLDGVYTYCFVLYILSVLIIKTDKSADIQFPLSTL